LEHLRETLKKLEKLDPPRPFRDDPKKPIEGLLLQLIFELELHLNRIDNELEYLTIEVERLKESI
jgi:hypothetical protein